MMGAVPEVDSVTQGLRALSDSKCFMFIGSRRYLLDFVSRARVSASRFGSQLHFLLLYILLKQ